MTEIIHKALYDRLAASADWLSFQEGFRVLTGLTPELLEELDDAEPAPGDIAVHVEVHGIHVAYMRVRWPKTRGRGQSGDDQEAARKACRLMLDLAIKHLAGLLAPVAVHEPDRLPPAVLKTCNWIRSRALSGEVRLTAAARHCGLSAAYLSRLFHSSTGLSFREYVTRFRLDRACAQLRATNRSVIRIAFECGFQTISQFNRSFKALHGKSPLAYRREQARLGGAHRAAVTSGR